MKNKKLARFLFSFILLSLLVACGSGSTPEEVEAPAETEAEEQPAETEAEEQPAESTVEEPAEDQFAGEELTLIYFDATYARAAEAVIPEFEEATGATVTLVTAPYASLYEKTFTDLVTSGGSYDVMQVASQWDGQFAPYMASIDDYLANDPDVDINDFIPGVARVTGIWDGVRFGIPNADDAYGIIYRTDIFEEAGIEVDPENWTWDEYAKIAEQLTTDEMFGTAIAGVKHQLDAYWTARYWSQGGHLMSEDWETALPERDTAVQSLDMIQELMPYMPPGVMSYDIPDENTAFVQGKVAMAELWPSLIRGTANDPEQSTVVGNWGVLPYPGHSPQLSSWSLGIPETSENKDLAWEWIKFYTQEEKQREYLDEFGIGPSLQAIYQDPAVIEAHPDFPNMLISLNGVRPRFRIAQSQETFDFLDDRISDALTGVLTSEEAIEEVVNQWEEKIGAAVPSVPYSDDYVEGGQVLAPAAEPSAEIELKQFPGEELTLMYFDATYARAAEAVIPEFEEATGATVTMVTAPYASLYEKAFTDLVTSGGAYDVLQVASQWDGQFSPYMASIDDYLANDPDVDINDFIPGVARVTGIWDGVRFGIPNADDAYGIIYRTDIFEEAGIEVDPENWTWDEYAKIAEQLTTDEMFGTAIAGVKHQLDAYWTARYWSQGGHLMSEDWETALPERDTAVQSLDMIQELMPYMPPGVMSYDIPDENTAFVQGKVAMAELWPSLIRGTANDPEQSTVVGNWGVLPYPGHSPQLSSWSLGIPETSENKDLAWEWIKFYTQEGKQREYLDEFGIGPSMQAIYQDPAVIEAHPDFPNMLISLNGVRPRFRIAQSQETFDFLDDRISDALTGVLTSEEAIEEVVNQWEEKIGAAVPETPYTDDYVE